MTRDRLEKQIAALLARHSHEVHRPAEDDDIAAGLGLTDEQLAAFLDDFADAFNVDMTAYLAYFHHSADKSGAHQLPYLANGKIAARMPITLRHLYDAAAKGRWQYPYPSHSLKTVGWRDVLQYALIAIVAVWIVVSFFL